MMKLPLRLVAPVTKSAQWRRRARKPNAELRTREYLTAAEVEKLIKAAGRNRWGHRDATLVLVGL